VVVPEEGGGGLGKAYCSLKPPIPRSESHGAPCGVSLDFHDRAGPTALEGRN
jgi:hypothetical protein